MSEITEQNQDRLIIVIPAYNEEENIENVVAFLYFLPRYMPESR